MTHDLTSFGAIIVSTRDESFEQRRTTNTLKMQISFIDSSVLYVRENVVRSTQWVDYAYQWQTAEHQLIRRWDNAHEIPGLATTPFHQHIDSEANVQPSESMTLEKVLTHIILALTSN